MARDDNWRDDDYKQPARDEWGDNRDPWGEEAAAQRPAKPPKAGMSSFAKVLIGVLVASGVLGLLCCGGFAFLTFRVARSMEANDDPEVVRQVTRDIVEIEIPPEFEPA